jgi:glycosyltransferase involved in cell wall biosynthesis
MSQGHSDWLAVAWAPHSRRSETFSRELGGKLYLIHYLRFRSLIHAAPKYLLQAPRTLQVLFKERPRAVHVQNPPFVAGLVVYLYCQTTGAKFVFDHHSAVFGPKWEWSFPFQKFLARRAATNIVTNQHWADVMHSWGAKSLIMYDPFLDLPRGETFDVKPGFNVAFISSFAGDEPLEDVLQAAGQLPDVHFFITGDTRRKPDSFFASAPSNVTFTGYLKSDSQYIGLLRAVDAIMALTTRNYTLQLAGCEAVSVGKPLITSDWPCLQELFAKGTVFVANSADSIRDGVLIMQDRHKELAHEITTLRQDRRKEWDKRLVQLKESVATK